MNAFGVEAEVDSLFFEKALDRRRNVFVFVLHETRAHFDDSDFAAEAAIHLRELESDVAAAYDDEVPWQRVELQDADIGEKWDGVDAGHVGDIGAAAYVEEDLIG